MARVKFTADYDHVWPSRAVTAFKAGWTGTVKAEVAEAARAAGKARAADGDEAADTLPNNLPAELGEPQALNPALRDEANSE